MQERTDNCTYLFRASPFHSSESFWTSVVALQILEASRGGISLSIPTFTYEADEKKWEFKENGSIVIPSGLDRSAVIVEGVLKDSFLKDSGGLIPNEFRNLKPDITIKLPGNKLWLIEVKTVGHTVGPQKQLREELANFLERSGYEATVMFIVSAGHEHNPDWKMFNTRLVGSSKTKLLLWEQLIKAIYEQVDDAMIFRCLGDLSRFCENESDYMKGNFQA